MRLVETIAEVGEVRQRRMMEGVNSVWYIWYIVRTFVNATMYSQHNKKIKILCF
jgi:hypothetical protein